MFFIYLTKEHIYDGAETKVDRMIQCFLTKPTYSYIIKLIQQHILINSMLD